MTAGRRDQWRATVTAGAPLVLLAGALIHPFVGNTPDLADIAEEATADPTRWAVGHLVLGIGIALMILLAAAVRGHLHEAGEDRWSFGAAALTLLGFGMFTFTVGAEGFGGRAAVAAGNAEAFFEAMGPWLIPTLLSASLLVAVGLLAFARAIAVSRILGTAGTRLAVAGAVTAAVGLFLPVGWATYVINAGTLAFAWPLAASMWRGPGREHAAEGVRHRESVGENA